MIIFDAMTNQDFVGPHDCFSRVRVAEIDVLSKTAAPAVTDAGGRILADRRRPIVSSFVLNMKSFAGCKRAADSWVRSRRPA